jgi:hypothetical protein
MYTPNRFASSLPWQWLLDDHAFGLLISTNSDDCWTTHLPRVAGLVRAEALGSDVELPSDPPRR